MHEPCSHSDGVQNLLMMRVPNPREGASNTDEHGDVGQYTEREDSIVVPLAVTEVVHDVHDEPKASRCRTA